MPLLLALGRQRQADPCEFRALHSLFGLYKEFRDSQSYIVRLYLGGEKKRGCQIVWNWYYG